MAKPRRSWTVTPHGPLEKLEDNLWGLSSRVPGAPITRRMLMARLADGRIVFLDAVPMDEPTLAAIRAWGTPAILVVSNGYHRLDVHPFREKLGLEVYAPAASRQRIAAAVQVDGDLADLPADPSLVAEPLDGVKNGEAVFVARAASGKVTCCFADAIMNPQSTLPLLARLLGLHGGPKVTPLFKLLFVKDRAALRRHFERLAGRPELGRLVFCHGVTVETDAAGGLRAAAATL